MFQGLEKIDRRSVAHGLELVVVRDVDVRAEVMGREAEADDQALVAKDLFLVTEYWVCELRVEARDRFRFLLAGLDDRDVHGVIGVACPW